MTCSYTEKHPYGISNEFIDEWTKCSELTQWSFIGLINHKQESNLMENKLNYSVMENR